ncbi:MAG: carbohydrate ABC transporter permease [Candidatus Hydrogenedentes bacterium]|nr:carbohydrate ABC transporter permease [Candidatus Hydrogenedentota bacterium]
MNRHQVLGIFERIAIHGVLVAAALVMLTPLVWMISTSLKASGHSLSRGIEWLPWEDIYVSDALKTPVIVLGARVRNEEAGNTIEVGIASLRDRRRRTEVSLPEGRFSGEVLEYRVRNVSEADQTAEAFWIPCDQLERRIGPRWSNYSEALVKMRFFSLLANTVAITFLGTLGTVLSCSLVAYGFARFRFPGRETLFMVLLSSMMLPPVVTMIPVYLIFRDLHWIDTLLPLFAPAWLGTNAFNVFLFRQFYMTLPFDLDDAARIDGCSSFRIYWSILLPLSKPVMATVGIFSFTGLWLDFMGPLIYLNSIEKFTLSLGLYIFKGPYTVQWDYLMAATLVVSLPCIVIFFLGQRFFIQGTVLSGLKA